MLRVVSIKEQREVHICRHCGGEMKPPYVYLTATQRRIFDFLQSRKSATLEEIHIHLYKSLDRAKGSVKTHIHYLKLRLDGTGWWINHRPYRLHYNPRLKIQATPVAPPSLKTV